MAVFLFYYFCFFFFFFFILPNDTEITKKKQETNVGDLGMIKKNLTFHQL